MASKNWSEISHLQLGKIAEYYAKIEFLSHGYEIYDTVVDDRGIDFVARKGSKIYDIQVKAVRNNNYTFITESKMIENGVVCYINFSFEEPRIYIFPMSVWNDPNQVFRIKEYKTKEYGINFSKKHEKIISLYTAELFFKGENER